MKRFVSLLCFLVFLLPCFFAYASPKQINDVYVIHFVLDGANKRVFDEMLESGKLPTIKQYFVDHGAVFTNALSNFPSTSTTIYQSYATGLLPGNAGIPHLERFDRETGKIIGYLTASGYLKINDDLINLRALENPDVARLDVPTTIFELLDGHPTYVLYSSFRRGASDSFPMRAPFHALWSTYVTDSAENVDYLAYKKLFETFKGKEIPRYTIVGLYSTDLLEHETGLASKDVKNAIIQFDVFFKEFLELLKQRGITDKTYIILSGDHGMHDTGNLFKLESLLLDTGIFVKPHNPSIKGYTLYSADRGISSTHAYVKHDEGWEPIQNADILRNHPKKNGDTIDLIHEILDLEPTMLLIVRDGERAVRIFDAEGGESRIECYTLNLIEWCSYKLMQNDPLHYGKKYLTGLLDGEPHNTLEWKKATADEEYPDAVIQLSQIFRDGRAGDFFVIPKPEWGFRKTKAATHGSIVADDMRVPMLIFGPTVPTGAFGVIRSPDIYPLMLDWFGIKIPKENHDGTNPFEQIAPESKEWQQLAKLEQAVANGKQVHASGKLMRLAQEELRRRQVLLEKLQQYESELAKKHAKNDHAVIVQRTIELTKERIERMQKIINNRQ